MLDARFVRENSGMVVEALAHRGYDSSIINEFLKIEAKRRELLLEVEKYRRKINEISEEIARLRREGTDVESKMREAKIVSEIIKTREEWLRELDEETKTFLLNIPNIPHESVPVGKDETENVEVRRWGEPRQFDFEPMNHRDIGEVLERLSILRGRRGLQGQGFP